MSQAIQKLEKRIKSANSLLSVGLDPDFDKLPERFKKLEQPQFEFNKWIIDQTHEFVCAYKPNTAFYEARGEQGWKELRLTIEYLKEKYPDIFTICDAKRADIGNTNRGYVAAIFDTLGFDAITLHPYLGKEALAPFLERDDKACIILCKTSNPGSGELQDLLFQSRDDSSRDPLREVWLAVAESVANDWNTHGNCMLVVGATYPDELKQVREIVGDMNLLIPGVGAQGGDVEATVKRGINSKGAGLVINSARGIIFADNPANSAQTLRNSINQYR